MTISDKHSLDVAMAEAVPLAIRLAFGSDAGAGGAVMSRERNPIAAMLGIRPAVSPGFARVLANGVLVARLYPATADYAEGAYAPPRRDVSNSCFADAPVYSRPNLRAEFMARFRVTAGAAITAEYEREPKAT